MAGVRPLRRPKSRSPAAGSALAGWAGVCEGESRRFRASWIADNAASVGSLIFLGIFAMSASRPPSTLHQGHRTLFPAVAGMYLAHAPAVGAERAVRTLDRRAVILIGLASRKKPHH